LVCVLAGPPVLASFSSGVLCKVSLAFAEFEVNKSRLGTFVIHVGDPEWCRIGAAGLYDTSLVSGVW